MRERHFRPSAPQSLFGDKTRPRHGSSANRFYKPGNAGYNRPTTPMNRGYGEAPAPRRSPFKSGLGRAFAFGVLVDLMRELQINPWDVPVITWVEPNYHSGFSLMYNCGTPGPNTSCVGTTPPVQPYATQNSGYTIPTTCPSPCENHGVRYSTFEDAAASTGADQAGEHVTFYLRRSATTGRIGKVWRRLQPGPTVPYRVAPAPVFYPFDDPWYAPEPWPAPQPVPEKYYGSPTIEGGLSVAPGTRRNPRSDPRPSPDPDPNPPPQPPGPPKLPALNWDPDHPKKPGKGFHSPTRPPKGDKEKKPPPWAYGAPGKVYGALTEGGDAAGCMIEAMGGSSKGLGTRGKFLKAWRMANDPEGGRPDGDAFVKCMLASQAQDRAIGQLRGGSARAQNRSPYSPKRPGGYRGGGWGTRMH